jgi:hypothetical protein
MAIAELIWQVIGTNRNESIFGHILFTLSLAFLIYVAPGLVSRICKNKRIDNWFKSYMRDEKSHLPFQTPRVKGLFLAVFLGLFGLLFMVGLLFLFMSILFFLKDLRII